MKTTSTSTTTSTTTKTTTTTTKNEKLKSNKFKIVFNFRQVRYDVRFNILSIVQTRRERSDVSEKKKTEQLLTFCPYAGAPPHVFFQNIQHRKIQASFTLGFRVIWPKVTIFRRVTKWGTFHSNIFHTGPTLMAVKLKVHSYFIHQILMQISSVCVSVSVCCLQFLR